jgi:hypothetical protein
MMMIKIRTSIDFLNLDILENLEFPGNLQKYII